MREGRILGLDLGEKRLGIALSDPSRTVASPLATIPHRSQREDIERIAALSREHEVAAVVVGWPRNMDGTSGPPARRAEVFAQALRRALAVPVELWDERLSTVAADRALIEGNVARRRRRALRDRVAAALILQAWLDARTRGLPAPSSGHTNP